MKNPTAPGVRQGLIRNALQATSERDTATTFSLNQQIDIIAILAARSRIAPATVAAQLSAWGLAVRS